MLLLRLRRLFSNLSLQLLRRRLHGLQALQTQLVFRAQRLDLSLHSGLQRASLLDQARQRLNPVFDI